MKREKDVVEVEVEVMAEVVKNVVGENEMLKAEVQRLVYENWVLRNRIDGLGYGHLNHAPYWPPVKG